MFSGVVAVERVGGLGGRGARGDVRPPPAPALPPLLPALPRRPAAAPQPARGPRRVPLPSVPAARQQVRLPYCTPTSPPRSGPTTYTWLTGSKAYILSRNPPPTSRYCARFDRNLNICDIIFRCIVIVRIRLSYLDSIVLPTVHC